MNKRVLLITIPLLLGAFAYAAQTELEAPSLTLSSIITKVKTNHPTISIAEAEILARQAEALQAGLRLNPELGVEVENFAGSGAYSGVDAAEYTFAISQTFELGGKRDKRKSAAVLQSEVARWAKEGQLRAVELITIRAFYATLATEARLNLSRQQVQIAKTAEEKAQQRVTAGRAHPLEVTKARIERADAELELQDMELALKSAKTLLSSLWGGAATDIEKLTGDLERLDPPASIQQLSAQLEQNPAYLGAEAVIRQQQASAAYEDAQRIPDIDLAAGVRFIEESGDQAFVVGMSIPLAFGNRNQGNREAARIRVMQAEDELSLVRLELNQALQEKDQEVQTAYTKALSLKTKQLPIAQEAFKQANDGYEKGLFGSLDLLDAMRSLFEQEKRYVGALLEYHQTKAELEVLVTPSGKINY